MNRYAMIFDFDGTLVDTRLGIIRSMQYALGKMGLPDFPIKSIEELIGKPLETMFALVFGEANSSSSKIWEGVTLFRSRYGKEGLLECNIYPEVEQTLKALVDRNIDLFILTSKPTQYAKDICSNFGILDYFRDIDGVEIDKVSLNKSIRLGQMITRFQLDRQNTVLVGDRGDDCIAAQNNDIPIIGVLYGYGSHSELETNGCIETCSDFNKLLEWVATRNWPR